MWVLSIIAVILVAVLVALLAWTRRASRFSVSVAAPAHVALGEQCVIEVEISNEAQQPIVLAMVTVDDTFTEHFEGLYLTPPPKSQAAALRGRAWSYGVEVQPNAHFSVSLTGRAARFGIAKGEIQAIGANLLGTGRLVEIGIGTS